MVARGSGVQAVAFALPFRLLAEGLQDEPGAGAAVGFHQEALSRGDPANEGLGQRFQAGFKGRNMTFVNACSCSVELVAVLADLQ